MEKRKKSRKELDAQIKYLKSHDQLTGVATLAFMRKKIDKQIHTYQQRAMAILLLDVDGFSLVNDTMGSLAGDRLLQQLAQRILLQFKQDDLIARKGGDEFILILQDADAEQASQRAQEMLSALNQPFMIDEQSVFMTVSMGISLYPDDGQCAEELIISANFALNQVKENGKNNYALFAKSLGEKMRYLHLLQKDLRKALIEEQFFIHYQPKIRALDKKMIGVEALLRWKHPDLGLVPPATFIPIAEKTELIIPIGDWVLNKACAQVSDWIKQYQHPFSMSVNVSGKQFQSSLAKENHLIHSVKQALEQAALSPDALELEITESIFMKDNPSTRHILKQLKALGVMLSCDDFGVGYSSFSQLKKLPIDIIKIDQSLIVDVLNNPVDITIIRSIIAIARQLHIQVIAEGVETEAQFLALMDLGCDIIQGNYFSKPVLANQIRF